MFGDKQVENDANDWKYANDTNDAKGNKYGNDMNDAKRRSGRKDDDDNNLKPPSETVRRPPAANCPFPLPDISLDFLCGVEHR